MSVKDEKIGSYHNNYQESWENEFDWVTRDPSSRRNENAYCKLCRRSLLPKMSVLVTHHKSQLHTNMASILQSNQEPRFERKRKQPRSESLLLRQTLSKTELELNEGSEVNQSVIVVSSGDHPLLSDVGQIVSSSDVGQIVSSSDVGQIVSSSDVGLVPEGRDPYSLSVMEDPASSQEAENSTGVVVEQELNLGLVDVNKMNIQEMELLDNEDTIMVLEEDQEVDDEEEAEHLEVEYDPGDDKPSYPAMQEDSEKSMESTLPGTLSSMVKVSALTHFTNTLQPEVLNRLKSGEDYDAIWRCDGAAFKVHKLVLAANSEYFKGLMTDDDQTTVIHTPDLSKHVVRSILCLLYSGKVNLTWALMNQVNDTFKAIGFFGNNLTATPQGEPDPEVSHTFQYNTSNPDLNINQYKTTKVSKNELVANDPFDAIEDFDFDADIGFEDNLLDDDEDFVDHREDLIESSDEEHPSIAAAPIIKTEVKTEVKQEPGLGINRSRRKKKKNQKYLSAVRELRKDLVNSNSKSKEPHDTISTYVLRTRGKGDLALSLKDDLFEDPNVRENVRVISVCLVCLQYFDNYEKLKEHKKKAHNKKRIVIMDYHKSILGNDQYRCTKCSQVLKLKHVVWLVKHLKFCGLDNQKANQLLGADDVEDRTTVDRVKEEESIMFVVADRGRNAHEMSRFFFNKYVHTIWGCRICYEVFSSQIEYEKHQAEIHQGSDRHGSCYDPETRVFTCMYCNTYKTARPLIHFIYHLKRCLCDPSIGANGNDEEDLDEDTTQDVIDPWGIVNKPLRVLNEKSKWICEALFGRYIPILFPCHICYTVFEMEEELKDHFRLNHAGQENCCDNGSQYDREKEVYLCPICKRQVCHKQKSAIYFAYHMRKCAGNTLPVSRNCPVCDKTFTSFAPYMVHTKNNCQTKDLLCHICSQSFKDIKYLANHLSYVHSTARPYQCTKCDKSYKRRPELNMHMQTHGDTMEYSCEKCGKAFFRKRNLKVHMLTHMSEAEKRFACHLCSHRFSKKAFLVNHLTTHSSFRRFACEVCGSQVKTKDSLKQHRKRVHKLITPLPQACVLQQEPEFDPKITTSHVVVKEETVIEDFQF